MYIYPVNQDEKHPSTSIHLERDDCRAGQNSTTVVSVSMIKRPRSSESDTRLDVIRLTHHLLFFHSCFPTCTVALVLLSINFRGPHSICHLFCSKLSSDK